MTGTEKILLNTKITKKGEKLFISILQGNTKIGEANLLISHNKSNAFLEVIEIEKEYQNQGYGSLLMHKIFEICDSKKVKTLSLFANFEKESLKFFYQKLGFKCNNKNIYKYEINIESAIKNLKKQEQLSSVLKFIPINPSEGNRPGTSGMVKKEWDSVQNLKIQAKDITKVWIEEEINQDLVDSYTGANSSYENQGQSAESSSSETSLTEEDIQSEQIEKESQTEDFEDQSSCSFSPL